MQEVEWGEFKLGDLFDIQNTLSFNADVLVYGKEFDYVTRTSINQGVLRETGFVNQENINPAGIWSLGLLQMDFFYRRKPWYAGQFVRKIIPKIELTEKSILFFTTLLNKQKKRLLSVLVRDVDRIFSETTIYIPILKNGDINFDFIDNFIEDIEADRLHALESKRLAKLEAYLSVTGLLNYNLTNEEQDALDAYNSLPFKEFTVPSLFKIKNTGNILSKDIVRNSGATPYLCASADNNAVSSYISYDKKYLDKGNCIFIGGKTFVVTYQKKDFFSNDSHNLTLYLKDESKRSKSIQLYIATCINKSLGHKYSWGNSISNKKIKEDTILLPCIEENINFNSMRFLISAIQKLVIKDVVSHENKIISATKRIINKNKLL